MSEFVIQPGRKENRISSKARIREKAVLAAIYEDCLQAFGQLTSATKVNLVWKPWYSRVNDQQSRLSAWGWETGASSRQLDLSLDYSLKKSTRLRAKTAELLGELHSTLCEALDAVRDAATSEVARTIYQRRLESVPTFVADGEAAHSSSSDEEDPLLELLQDVNEILDGLNALAPNLQDPAPQDIYERDLSPSKGKATRDIELAARMFPSSAPWLIYRLGNANWRRRRYLESLHNKSNKFPSRAHQRPKRSEDSPAGIQTQPPSIAHFHISADLSAPTPNQQIITSTATSETGKSSMEQTIFSGPFSTRYTVSTATGTQSEVEIENKVDWSNTCFIIPPPPVLLQDGNKFICPYCMLEVTVGDGLKTDEDWCRHVFADLEPYLCTFKGCIRADKTFGMKDDWIRHELDSHRIHKVWYCQSCHEEYVDIEEFESHFTEKHKDLFGDGEIQGNVMSTLSERSSEQTSTLENCLLCKAEFEGRRNLEDHLANHLEQFALTSISFVSMTDGFDADSSSETFDDNASERRVRLENLNTFVEEQLEYLLPRLEKPPDDDMEGSNLDFVEDSDDDRPRGKGNNVLDSTNTDAWKSKVASFLQKQPSTQTAQGEYKPFNESNPVAGEVIAAKEPAIKSTRTAVRTNIPPRNDEFEGRAKILERIRSGVAEPGNICILSGAGGIGKSATALEYVYRDDSPLIFWIQAETSFGCADAYCLIATQLRLVEGEMQEQDNLILIARQFLETTRDRWLLVFDNANSWSDIKLYIPRNLENTQGSVLLTTRKIDFGRQISSAYLQIELGVLTMEESKRLLLHSIQAGQRNEDLTMHPEYELAGRISSLAEHFPLAISHIAGYVKVSHCTLADFLELWQERLLSSGGAMNEDTSQTEKTLETVWNIGLRELTIDGLSLLQILAFLDSDSIQQDLLIGKHQLPSLEFLNSAESVRYKRMVRELSSRRLVTVRRQDGQDVLSIHRLLQQKILQDLDKDIQKREHVFAQVFALIRKGFPETNPILVPQPEKWPQCMKVLPHVSSLRIVVAKAVPRVTPTLEMARLLADGGTHLWERGKVIEALRLMRTSEAVLKKQSRDDEQLRANIDIIIALLVQHFGISHRAEVFGRVEKAYQRREAFERVCPSEEYTRNHAILLNNAMAEYGCALLQYNKHKEAEKVFDNCLAKYQEWGTEEEFPFEYAKYYHHVAFCKMYQGSFNEAIKSMENSIALTTQAIGDNVHLSYGDLACIVLQSGDFQRSLEIQQKLLSSRIELHGKSGLLTMQTYYAIGALQSYLGNLKEAEKCIRIALNGATEGFWHDAAVARAQFHLSQILKEQNKDTEEAAELLSKAKSVLDRLLPLDPIEGVAEEHELVLFDHLQSAMDGRFTGRNYLQYVSQE